MMLEFDANAEWLEADGLGGFASGTVSGIRRRRYHALLLAATTPPTGRVVLVNGFDAWVDTPAGKSFLSSQAYLPDVTHPDGHRRIDSFEAEPWPRWSYRLDDSSLVEQEIFAVNDVSTVAISWRLRRKPAADPNARASARGTAAAMLGVRPFLSGRDHHSLHHENPAFRFEPASRGGRLVWRPYESVPGIVAVTNAEYVHEPLWYRGFLYEEERERGLDFSEDLASPGTFRWDLVRGEAVLILAAEGHEDALLSKAAGGGRASAAARLESLRVRERRRRSSFRMPLHRAADAYIVRRGSGKTIVAGYPWFTDWGRDTFISLRGLCLATGRLVDAKDILVEWASAVSEGMLPNLFPDGRSAPEYNSVDASLWYVIAVNDFFKAMDAAGKRVSKHDRESLEKAVEAILEAYTRGTRYGIRMDSDGLLAAGQAGVQLTWMDAKVGDWVVTARIGKPVEIQALWLNALRIAAGISVGRRRSSPREQSIPGRSRWSDTFERGCESFRARFWNERGGFLFDVIDVDHEPGTTDATFRPNQIFAVGGLPFALLEGGRARLVIEAVEERLITPLGPRSLAPGEPGYAPRCCGGVAERDGSYHQGTVWPWLTGPFVEAWVRVRGGGSEARRQARERYLAPLFRHLNEAGLGHVSEIADAEPPHTPRGCPFQAWSLGELLRLDRIVLANEGEQIAALARHGADLG